MNPHKAIEILQSHVKWCNPVKEVDTYDALKLGIEALKQILAWQNIHNHPCHIKLPGETDA